jgi:hypothetical protein
MGGGAPFNIHTAPPRGGKDPFLKIRFHVPVDSVDPSGPVRIFKINFGKHTVQGGGRIPNEFLYLLPIGSVLGKLIAGNDRPFLQINPFTGQQNFRNPESQRGKPLMYIWHGPYTIFHIFE